MTKRAEGNQPQPSVAVRKNDLSSLAFDCMMDGVLHPGVALGSMAIAMAKRPCAVWQVSGVIHPGSRSLLSKSSFESEVASQPFY